MPKVSIIILNWNGKRFLRRCLLSLRRVTYAKLEVILVDNNSSDGSVAFVRKHFPWVKLVASKKNNGFAKGNNLGAQMANGKYLLFLNNDTRVSPAFLTPLVEEMQKDKTIGCLQPQMRVMDEPTLQDEAGSYLTWFGFLYHYGYRKNHALSLYRKKREIFSAKGACMLIPKDVFVKVGGFDEDFFIFFEESDLCYRIWLSGKRVIYNPQSYISHVVGGDTSSSDTYSYARRIYLTIRNMTATYLKNFGAWNLCTIYPVFLGVQAALVFYYVITGKFYLVRAVLAAYRWNIMHIKKTLKKRSIVQGKLRRRSDRELNRHIMYNPGFIYVYYSLTSTQQYKDKAMHTIPA